MSKVAKITCRIVHNSSCGGSGHLWVQYKISGEWVDSDPAPSRPNLRAVWNNCKWSVSAYAQQGQS